jgi:hypothetical protein
MSSSPSSEKTIEHDATAALANAIHAYVKSLYDGAQRVG